MYVIENYILYCIQEASLLGMYWYVALTTLFPRGTETTGLWKWFSVLLLSLVHLVWFEIKTVVVYGDLL